MVEEVANGKREKSFHLFDIDNENFWGKTIIALSEAFHVDLVTTDIIESKS